MKKTLIVLLLIISTNLFSQVAYKYYEVPSGTTNELRDIGVFNYTNNYICGNSGTLLRIFNADSNCSTINTGVGFNINSFFRFSGSYLYPLMFFADNGMLIKSTNYGINWSQSFTGFVNNLYSGIFIKFSTPYSFRTIAVGSSGVILRRNYYPSSDTAWKQISGGTAADLKCITAYKLEYPDYPYLWICGSGGTILKSIDTGNSWSQMISGTANNLNSLYFKTKDTGFVIGSSGIILKTVNGGINWIQKTSNVLQNLNSISQYGGIIYIAGDKVFLISTNGGENWTSDTAVPKYNFNIINFLYSNRFQKNVPVIAGESGKVYKRILDTTYNPNINVLLNGNNISAKFRKYGTLDNDNQIPGGDRAGFEWPKGSGKTAVFTAGLCIGAFVNNQLKQASASYIGEYSPGYCEHGIYKTSSIFKYYKIIKGDNSQTSWDWANWGLMVPYGAPFIDANNNGRFEPEIDTPGVKNAAQTIFYCMTDADYQSHTAGEGFGGGTLPLGAEVHLTAWVYDSPGLQDVQFINYGIINKSDSIWKRTYIGFFSDPDLGESTDDFTGCDTSLKLSFCYNTTNNDYQYGANPPAMGFLLLSGSQIKTAINTQVLGMTCYTSPYKYLSNCEGEQGWYGKGAYFTLTGFKNDSTCHLDPTQTPYKKTKFTYAGEPETNTGWTRIKGCIQNCNKDSTGNLIAPGVGADLKMVFSSGAENLEIAPGDTQRFVVAQLIARGTSNLNSVTVLKSLCGSVRNFYEANFPFVINPAPPPIEYPTSFMLDQNYPNPFNATTRIKFHIPKINSSITGTVRVVLKIYDLLGREVKTLINGDYSAQDYEVIFEGKNFASGMYVYRMTAGDYVSVKRMVLVK